MTSDGKHERSWQVRRDGKTTAAVALQGVAIALSCLVACTASRSSSIRDPCCAAYQGSNITLPDQPGPGVVRLAIGGDSRDDHSQVLPWAFKTARERGAKAFFYLGDLEITRLPGEEKFLAPKIAELGGVPFYPVVGNHEVEVLGVFKLPGTQHAVKEFKEDFLNPSEVNLAPFTDEVVYSANLEGGVHLIALDNVSRKGEGFGSKQLAWLAHDLKEASNAKKLILVGMHKGLANNPVTTHAMDEDGENAKQDSTEALALFKQYNVAMVFVSHSHMYASYNQEGVEVRLTGGLGAPLVKGLAKADGGFHHFLLLDVPPGGNGSALQIEVVRFQGSPTRDDKDESLEAER